MNKVVVAAATVVAILAAVTWFLLRFGAEGRSLSRYSLVLTNVPQNYCPQLAWVAIFKNVDPEGSAAGGSAVVDEEVTVVDCRVVTLVSYRAYLEDADSMVVLKLPRALAFKVPKLFAAKDVVEYGVPLGDVTADNAIDDLDLNLIRENLFREAVEHPAADVDGDSQISMLDYSYSQVNRGVGVLRPDGQIWPEKVRQ